MILVRQNPNRGACRGLQPHPMSDRTGRPSRSARDLPRGCGHAWRLNSTYSCNLEGLRGTRSRPWPCKACRCVSRTPSDVTTRLLTHTLQTLVARLYALGVSHWVPGHGAWSPGGGVGPDTLWQDGQRVAAWLTRRLQTWCPPVVLVDETWFPIGGARRLVAVVMDPMGHQLEMRVAGLSTGRPDSPTGNGAVWHSW